MHDSSKIVAFNYFGGKTMICDQIIALMPEHKHYIECFAGSLAVALNKPAALLTTVNDLNFEIVNFFQVLRTRKADLIESLALTPLARAEYESAWPKGTEDPLERARLFYVRVRQSFYGLGAGRKSKGWLWLKTATRNAENATRWRNSIDSLTEVAEVILNFQIENRHFRDLIPQADAEGALFYCDPPYPKAARASFGDYAHEMTEEEHRELAMVLHSIKGKAIVSGYDCALYRKLYKDWELHKFSPTQGNIRKGSRQECVWLNYESKSIRRQLEFF